MSRSIISRGATLDEAIQTGLQLLQTTMADVDMDIIQTEKKGLFRLKNKQAIVKLTVVNKDKIPSKQQNLEDVINVVEGILKDEKKTFEENKKLIEAEENLKGKAWIENGKVIVRESPTHLPVLIPGDNVTLYKNSKEFHEAVVVSADDEVRIEVQNEKTLPTWSIKVDSANMEARFLVNPGYETFYRVQDCEPSHTIKINVNKLDNKTIPIPINEVITRLNELGVCFGIDYEEIRRGIETEVEASFIIARGQPPKLGKNGDLKYLIDMEYKKKQPKERSDGTLDFRESFHVPSVSPGQVITDYIPPVPGESGKNIYGVDIPAPPVYDLTFHAKNGVILLEPENKLVAKEQGRPHIEKRGTLVKASILPKLTVRENVDIENGNIHFIGDVELLKNVHEKMIVEADGDIVLHGNADFATLTAGNSIFIKRNAINCEITAGKGNMLISELYHLLGDIENHLYKLIQAVKQLYSANAFKTSDLAMRGLGALIKLLLERKFSSLIPLLKELIKKVQQDGNLLDNEWSDLADRLNKGFLILSKDEFHSIEELMHLLQEVGRFYQISSLPPEPDSTITIGYALKSSIYCSGDVQILKTGCYNCKINSGGMIKVNGYVRGGSLYAKYGAKISETGSEGGSRAVIQVPAGQSIRITRVNEGTIVQVGNKSHLFTENAYEVHARLDQNEKLLLF